MRPRGKEFSVQKVLLYYTQVSQRLTIRNDSFELCIIHFFMCLLILQTFIEHEHLQGTVGYLKDAEDLVCHKIHSLVGSIGMLMKNY